MGINLFVFTPTLTLPLEGGAKSPLNREGLCKTEEIYHFRMMTI